MNILRYHPMKCGITVISLALLSLKSYGAADIDQPIYPDPATSPNQCMADAYIDNGGSGLRDEIGEDLNCTANDVEITEVIPKAIRIDETTTSTDLTCTIGSPFTLIADVKVRSNAAERWDTTFYIPRKEGVQPDVISKENDACSLIIPVPEGTSGFVAGGLVAQQLDTDVCGDIAKADLTNDEYTLVDAEFTMICEDRDPDGDGPLLPDGRADFNYCAAWDNIERANCSVDGSDAIIGQAPNNKSKCNCDNFDIDVFVEPDPPGVTKTLLSSSSSANESGSIFEYRLTITKATGADVNITNIEDLYYSDTDSAIAGVLFDLDSTTSNTTDGNLTLLAEHANHTCDELSLPITLTSASPSVSCDLVVQISDEDLPDDDGVDPYTTSETTEQYENFIRFSATDSEGRGTVVGDDTCNTYTDTDQTPDTGDNCSNLVLVNINNIDPVAGITKDPLSGGTGVGLRQVPATTGPWFFDADGDVTFQVVITNNSSVDSVYISSLVDDNGTAETSDDIDLLSDTTGGSDACSRSDTPVASDMSTWLAPGGTFTCNYVLSVSATEGSGYTNTATVALTDNENRTGTNNDSATITKASPMISLVKEVAKSIDVGVPTPAIDSAAFVDSVAVNEPGEEVVYRFSIFNNNSVTEESVTLNQLVDDTLFADVTGRVSIAATQRDDECDFSSGTEVVAYDGDSEPDYVCTIVATITGDATDLEATTYDDTSFTNTAKVTATAENGASVETNTDTATVTFDNVAPTIDAEFALQATVFIRVTNTSAFEDITLSQLKVLGNNVVNNATIGNFTIKNVDGVEFFDGSIVNKCPEPGEGPVVLAKDESLECAFTVMFSDGYTADDFATFEAMIQTSGSGGVFIEFVDDEGSMVSADAEVVVDSDL